jgi:hypothetical protein
MDIHGQPKFELTIWNQRTYESRFHHYDHLKYSPRSINKQGSVELMVDHFFQNFVLHMSVVRKARLHQKKGIEKLQCSEKFHILTY